MSADRHEELEDARRRAIRREALDELRAKVVQQAHEWQCEQDGRRTGEPCYCLHGKVLALIDEARR